MKRSILVLIMGFMLVSHAYAQDNMQTMVKGNTTFALDLYGQLKQQPGNLFFSPYSISTALAMTYAGARGRTENEMAAVMHFPDQKTTHPGFAALLKQIDAAQGKKSVILRVANALWAQKGHPFLKPFLSLVKKNYNSEVKPVDFRAAPEPARREINAWVSKKTEHKIEDLLPPGILNSLNRLVLVNAVYFKGRWAEQFAASDTKNAPFHLTPDKTAPVPMMYKNASFGYTENSLLQALELPYAGNTCSMVVLLPKSDLSTLEKELTADNLSRWLAGLKRREVSVWLPKYKLTSAFSLKETLAGLGMHDAFDPANADFSGMDGRRELSIGGVIHKAYVDVNEEGTEAAAATAVVMMKLSAPAHRTEFRADHPFLFLIRDKTTGSILFLGRVVNPK